MLVDNVVNEGKKNQNYNSIQQIQLICVTSDTYRYVCCFDKPIIGIEPTLRLEI